MHSVLTKALNVVSGTCDLRRRLLKNSARRLAGSFGAGDDELDCVSAGCREAVSGDGEDGALVHDIGAGGDGGNRRGRGGLELNLKLGIVNIGGGAVDGDADQTSHIVSRWVGAEHRSEAA